MGRLARQAKEKFEKDAEQDEEKRGALHEKVTEADREQASGWAG